MPSLCCVPCCRSNYRNSEQSATMFKFPKDISRQNQWIRAIHRDNFEITNASRICIKHFAEKFIIREDRAVRPDGTVLIVPRTRLKLTEDAYPTIFDSQPNYMTVNLPKKRKDPNIRAGEISKRKKDADQLAEEKDAIKNFDSFKNSCLDQLTLIKTEDIHVKKLNDVVCIFNTHINSTFQLKITSTLIIKRDLSIEISHKGFQVSNEKIREILGKESKCDSWSKFRSLIAYLQVEKLESKDNETEAKLKQIIKLFTELIDHDSQASFQQLAIMKFVREQTSLIFSKQNRYSTDTLIWASLIYYTYPGAYKHLRNSSMLTLPHPKWLNNLSMKLGTENSGIGKSHIKYLEDKLKSLEEKEKIVCLMLDEIYVKSTVEYKGGKILGLCSANDSNNLNKTAASTIQTFMIKSVLSHNKDVVGLFPITTLKSTHLHELTLQVLKILHQTGYQVVSIISDNNRVNRAMFELMCGGTLTCSIRNPSDAKQEIFILFDPVHAFKSIRNNWLNQKDSKQTFIAPDIPTTMYDSSTDCDKTYCGKIFSSVSDLKNLYAREENNVIKLAPSLSRKVLYPSSLERQNVKFCVRLFDDKNAVALREMYKDKLSSVEDTTKFLDLFSRWWKVVNCKSRYKGIELRDPFSGPILHNNDQNLIFLEKIVDWLNKWDTLEIQGESNSKHGKRCGKLTAETQVAVTHLTKTLIALSKYLINVLGFEYVLLGKFQTDDLEARFGQYRQMSGGNYHVSVTQILESEQRLKIISLLKLKSANTGEFQLIDFLNSCEAYSTEDREEIGTSETFEDVLIVANDEIIPETDTGVLIYIAGYIVNKMTKKFKCHVCRTFMCYNRTLEIDLIAAESECYKYIKSIDRGGLKWPKEYFVDVIGQMYVLFKTLISDMFESKFQNCCSQKRILKYLSFEMMIYKDIVLNETCECGTSRMAQAKMCVDIFSNILLNNYSKILKNKIEKEKNSTKKKKKSAPIVKGNPESTKRKISKLSSSSM